MAVLSKGRVRWLALVAALGLVATACGDDDEGGGSATTGGTTGTGAATTEASPTGGRLVMVHALDPRSLDPVGSSSASPAGDAPQFFAIYDSLMMEDPETTKVVPQIAESLTTTDSRVWTLKLRPNVKFSDGTPYDAAAVKLNTERHQDPANRSQNASLAQGIASMEVVDPLTLRYTLKEANSQFDRIVAKRLGYIASPTALAAKGAAFADAPVGAGPFTVKQWIRGSQLELVRNANYWNAPRPYLDELVIQFLSDGAQRINTLKAGQSHVMFGGTTPIFAKEARDAGFEVYDLVATPVGGAQLQMNMKRPPFDDQRVRLAVAHGLNLEEFNKVINGGAGEVPKHLMRPPSPFHDPALTLPSYDPQRAQRLIDEYVAEKGGPLEFTFLVGTAVAAYGEFFQANMAQYRNVRTHVEIIEGVQVPPRLATGDFDIVTFSLGGPDPEPDFYDHFHSTGSRNYPKYANPEVDAALEEARRTTDEARRKEAYRTVQRLVIRDMPDIWLNVGTLGYALNDKVVDYAMNSTSPLWDRIRLRN